MASGFHGGGGAVKTDEEGMEWTPTGCMCGALASGVLILGILYGRTEPGKVRYGCISQLSAHLHKRFQEELGGKCCAMLRPFYHKIDEENSCKEIYRKGAELAVEVALSAPDLVPECKMPRALRGTVKRFPGGVALGGALTSISNRDWAGPIRAKALMPITPGMKFDMFRSMG